MPFYYMDVKTHIAVFMVETGAGPRLLNRTFLPSRNETNLAFRERVEDAIAEEFKGISVMHDLFIIQTDAPDRVISGIIPSTTKNT